MRGGMVLFVLLPLFLGILVQMAAARPQGSWMAIEQGPEPQVATPRPVIEFSGDRLSVRARNAPWDVVLQELARLTGARIRTERPLPGTLSQEFEALPLEQGLRRLLREANYVFFYAKGEQDEAPIGKLTELWLLPKEVSATQGRQRSSSETAAAERPPEADFTDKAVAAIPPEQAANSESQSAVEELEPADRLEALEASIRDGETEALQAALLDRTLACRRGHAPLSSV